MYFEQIKEMIKVFSENRNAQKIAKKLGLTDKGMVRSYFRMETDSTGSGVEREFYEVDAFCWNRLRIGLSERGYVKWCATCECIISEEGDGGGGDGSNGDTSPDQPIPPSVIFDTKKLMDKLTKQPS